MKHQTQLSKSSWLVSVVTRAGFPPPESLSLDTILKLFSLHSLGRRSAWRNLRTKAQHYELGCRVCDPAALLEH